jgi:hypothetical protein
MSEPGEAPRPNVEVPHRTEMIRGLTAGVGRLFNDVTIDKSRPVTMEGTGFVVESPLDGLPYVVTAQHCVNPSYVDPFDAQKNRIPFRTDGRRIKFMGLDSPIRLLKAHYLPDDTDVALIGVHLEDHHLVEGRALELMTEDEFNGPSDDGYDYVAGFPAAESGSLMVQSFQRNTPFVMQGRLQGFSGGSLSSMINGRVKIASVISKAVPYGTDDAVETLLTCENPRAFRRDLQQLFRDAQQTS